MKVNFAISFLVLLMIIPALSLNAQEVKISREIGIRNEFVYEVLPNDNGNILVYRDRGQQFYFDIFNQNLDFVRTADIEFDERRSNILRVCNLKDKVQIYYQFSSRDTAFFLLKTFDGNAEYLGQDTLMALINPDVRARYRSVLSEDESKLAIFAVTDNLYTAVFETESGELIYDNKLRLERLGDREGFRNFTVANDGNVFVLFEVDNSASDDNHHFILLKTIDQSAFSLHKIRMPDKFSTGVKFSYDNRNDRVGIAGLYCDRYEGETHGTYILNLPKSELGTDMEFTYNPYDSELIREMYGKKRGKDNVIRDQYIRKLYWREDGGLILITEMQKEYVRRTALTQGGMLPNYTSAGSSYRSRGLIDYYHEDMMIFAYHPDGRMHWRNVLFKKQFSQDDDGVFSSFFVYHTPSRIHILYNDEIKNNNTVSEYVIDPIGRFERNTVLNTDYQSLKLRFQDAIQIKNNTFIVPSEKNYKLSLVKVVY